MRFLFVLLLSLPLMHACSSNKLPESCGLKPESGKCRASLTRWYLDERTGVCKPFIWGGCDGVAPFETLESCHAQCMPGQELPAQSTLIKQQPAVETPVAPTGSNMPAAAP